jgi:hypothetical protein
VIKKTIHFVYVMILNWWQMTWIAFINKELVKDDVHKLHVEKIELIRCEIT